MREHKYHAWDKVEKKIRRVLEINYWYPEPSGSHTLHGCKLESIDKSWWAYVLAEDLELLECTPVNDSKGNEIYESDFVNWITGESLDGMYKVVWIEHGWYLQRESDGHKEPLYANLADGKGSRLEVICSSYGWKEQSA
jgi:hypothetical protein